MIFHTTCLKSLLLLLWAQCLFAQPGIAPKARFQNLSVEDGLSQSSVFCMLQDRQGFLWMGTRDGLNRFDGYQFKVFKSVRNQPDSMAGNLIFDLEETEDGYLWIASGDGGLSRYDPKVEAFLAFRHESDNPNSISSNVVRSIAKGRNQTLWIGTFGGLNAFDRQSQTFRRIENPGDLPSFFITELAYDAKRNHLWIGTKDRGVFWYDIDSNRFEALDFPGISTQEFEIESLLLEDDQLLVGTARFGLFHVDLDARQARLVLEQQMYPDILNSNYVYALYRDRAGQLWASVELSGLLRLDNQFRIQAQYLTETDRGGNFAANTLSSILVDNFGLIWVGSDGGGVYKLDPRALAFQNYLTNHIIRAILEEPNGDLWVGTYGDTLYRFKAGSVTPKQYTLAPLGGLSTNTVLSIWRTQSGRLFIGTDGLGIWEYQREQDRFELFALSQGAPIALPDNHVFNIYQDRNETLWVGTETFGLVSIDLEEMTTRSYPMDPTDPNGLHGAQIWDIYEDSQDRLWVATATAGLHLLDRKTHQFQHFRHDPDNANSLSSDNIKAIHEDTKGLLWVGTAQGLNRYNHMTETWTIYREGDALPNNMIYSILQYQPDTFWLSTNYGLVMFKPGDASYTHFTYEDGLQSNEFNTAAYFLNHHGRMYFGGINGITSFHPREIPLDQTPPAVVFTQFLVNNQSVAISSDQTNAIPFALTQSLNFTDTVTLPYTQSTFSLEFAALHFANPKQNQYEFRLHGWDQVWIQTDAQHRRATYSQLPPGEYRFEVRASNRDRAWTEQGRQVVLHILPPLYLTWWAKTLYVLAFLLIVWIFVRRYQHELQRQRQLAEERRILAEKERDLSRQLEQEVSARTRDLKQQNLQLEILDEIAYSINRETSLSAFVNRVLEMTQFIHFVSRARILFQHPGNEQFHYFDVVGDETDGGSKKMLSKQALYEQYLQRAHPLGSDLFVVPNEGRAASNQPERGDTLILHLQNAGLTLGYLIFENHQKGETFRQQDLALLRRLKAHLVSAFVKNCMLEELEEANRRKNEFLGIAAHDLRSPLQGIVFSAEFLEELLDENSFDKQEFKQVLGRTLDAAAKMVHLLDELLDISAIEAGKLNLNRQILEIRPETKEVFRHFAHLAKEKEIELVLQEPNESFRVFADRYKLSEVLDNLISNAIKYTASGGQVSVFFERQGKQIITHVADTGQGLSEEDLGKVFQSFQTLSAKPTAGERSIGLGLAIVKKIIEAHGGKVWVKSHLGVGSTFSFSLPEHHA